MPKYKYLLLAFFCFLVLKTNAQITLVKDLWPGPVSSFIANNSSQLAVLNNKVYFSAYINGKTGLYESDGTSGGTIALSDTSIHHFVADLTAASDFLAYRGQMPNGSPGSAIWRSHAGSPEFPGYYNDQVQTLFSWQNSVYYSGHTGDEGFELWKLSSSGIPQMVKNLPGVGYSPSGPTSLSPSNFVAHTDGYLYFLSWAANFDCSLWKTDGTTSGTTKVKNVPYASSLISAGSFLAFIGPTVPPNYYDGFKLWKSDGTEAGTSVLKDLWPGNYASIQNFKYLNGKLYFLGGDANGEELWQSDGTGIGTFMVNNLNPGSGSSSPLPIGEIDDILFFSADNGTLGPSLWQLNTTSNTISLVKDINESSAFAGEIQKGVTLNNILYFPANDGINGLELWKTDGMGFGTEMIQNLEASDGSYPRLLTAVNHKIFIKAFTAPTDFELFVYNDPTYIPCQNDLILSGLAILPNYEALNSIISSQTVGAYQGQVGYFSKSITLDVGFHTDNGAVFLAQSGGCD